MIYEQTVRRKMLERQEARTTQLETFANRVWELALVAQAELDNGDPAEANGRLVEIAEAAAAVLQK